MKAHIIYYNFLTPDGKNMSIGGIQTYITNLIPVLKSMGYSVNIYQRGDIPFERDLDGVRIYGYEHHEIFGKKLFHLLFEGAKKHIDKDSDIVIFGTDPLIVPCEGYKTIAIQHGIYWDVPEFRPFALPRYIYHYIKKAWMAWQTISRASLVDKIVCVDYNFVNWFRALVLYPKVQLSVIPNFSSVPDAMPDKPEDGTVRIIFARRMQVYRGTRIFARAARRVLDVFPNVRFTVAGNGPDEKYVHDTLGDDPRVEYITYQSDESMQIHADKHIAVVPTTGSEGTSLSLLEAMASGCAVVCTNVGGMTNIVIDRHNGLMIEPDEEKLYNAMCTLIKNELSRKELASKAHETVKDSFSLDLWRERWSEIIQEVSK